MIACIEPEQLAGIFKTGDDFTNRDESRIWLEIPDECVAKLPPPPVFNDDTLTVTDGGKTTTLSKTRYAIAKYLYAQKETTFTDIRENALNGEPIGDTDLGNEVGWVWEALVNWVAYSRGHVAKMVPHYIV